MEDELTDSKLCIICLEECLDDNYLKFPISKSNCECKYNMHLRCLREWKKWNV